MARQMVLTPAQRQARDLAIAVLRIRARRRALRQQWIRSCNR